MKVDTQPWIVPNYVTLKMPSQPRQAGFVEAPKLHVRDVDAETLARMADEWRAELFRKAGKADPMPEER